AFCGLSAVASPLLCPAGAVEPPPAFDVDLNLAGGRTPDAATRRRRNPYAAADVDAVVVLTFLHQADDLDHRALVRLDLVHQLLRSVHAQMHALADLEGA